ncbi:hypothetical protein GCM10010276_49290 [Streptomyces longisporus]|uniref:Uncharacterized protein n=1 Tax=Streptomyces longisporus TaxID=1948 RepID=A0ABP5ZPL8_STRLO
MSGNHTPQESGADPIRMRDSEEEEGDNDVMPVSFGATVSAVKVSSECLDKTLTGLRVRG